MASCIIVRLNDIWFNKPYPTDVLWWQMMALDIFPMGIRSTWPIRDLTVLLIKTSRITLIVTGVTFESIQHWPWYSVLCKLIEGFARHAKQGVASNCVIRWRSAPSPLGNQWDSTRWEGSSWQRAKHGANWAKSRPLLSAEIKERKKEREVPVHVEDQMVGEEKESKASRKGGALPFWVRDFLSPDSIRPLSGWYLPILPFPRLSFCLCTSQCSSWRNTPFDLDSESDLTSLQSCLISPLQKPNSTVQVCLSWKTSLSWMIDLWVLPCICM